MRRLGIIAPAVAGLIFVLLLVTFGSIRAAGLILFNLPFALAGGVFALWLSGLYLSVPASVGFIVLFGVAVLNGVVLISSITQLRAEGMPAAQAVVAGCDSRLRPVLMTAAIAIFSLLPMVFATGPGRRGPASARRGRRRRADDLDAADAARAAGAVRMVEGRAQAGAEARRRPQ